MIYKKIKTSSILHSNADGKSDNVRPIVGVGIFEREDSQTYILLCTIDKNIDDAEAEASRIATLLNENRKYLTQKEAELKGLRLS
jgi:hypothetical protein